MLSLQELSSLLQLLHPSIFPSGEAFTSVFYSEETRRKQGTTGFVAKTPEMNLQLLQRIVSAFILRRTIAQVRASIHTCLLRCVSVS